VGSNEYLGRTPFRRKVEYRDDRTTFVIFRLAGHLEMTKEIRPDFVGAVTLQELPPPVAPAPVPTPPPVVPVAVPPPTHPPAGAHKAEPSDKGRPTRPHGKGHGKGGGGSKEKNDPFDLISPAAGHKASPFN
jgi:hypothetical protein